MLEKTPLDCKEIKAVSPKGNQSRYSLQGLMLKLKLQYFGYLIWRTDSIGKDPDAGKDWRQEKGMIEDEMVGWHHQLDRHEFEQAPGVGDKQGSLVCCSPWGGKESDTTDWLNWTALMCLGGQSDFITQDSFSSGFPTKFSQVEPPTGEHRAGVETVVFITSCTIWVVRCFWQWLYSSTTRALPKHHGSSSLVIPFLLAQEEGEHVFCCF